MKLPRGNMVALSEPITLQEHLDNWGMRGCPLHNSLQIFQQKFALHIIRNMMILKHTKFHQFLESIEGINTKTLSIRLKQLEGYGLIKRKVAQKRPLQVEYILTEKGYALNDVIIAMAAFSAKYESEKVFKDKKPRDILEMIGTDNLSEIYE